MKVKDVMHKGVDWVSPDTPVAEIAKPHRTHGRQSVAMPFFSFAPRG